MGKRNYEGIKVFFILFSVMFGLIMGMGCAIIILIKLSQIILNY